MNAAVEFGPHDPVWHHWKVDAPPIAEVVPDPG
jgi:hypothetical protein